MSSYEEKVQAGVKAIAQAIAYGDEDQVWGAEEALHDLVGRQVPQGAWEAYLEDAKALADEIVAGEEAEAQRKQEKAAEAGYERYLEERYAQSDYAFRSV